MPRMTMLAPILMLLFCAACQSGEPDAVIDLWPGNAPGETTRNPGEALPRRPDENPPATRIQKITSPQMLRFDPPADQKCGTSLIILPGGGYRYVVVDKEGSEIADRLTQVGITAFVLKYRTADQRTADDWRKPVQDAQRAVRLIRAHAAEWKLDPDRVGIIGFSAGGNAAAIASTNLDVMRTDTDDIDALNGRPNFTMLIYPWQLVGEHPQQLREIVTVDEQTPPTFLVHAHDDSSTSMSSIAFYSQLKQHKVSGELHLYQAGGHGYGIRPVQGTNIHTWPERAEEWLRLRGLLAHQK